MSKLHSYGITELVKNLYPNSKNKTLYLLEIGKQDFTLFFSTKKYFFINKQLFIQQKKRLKIDIKFKLKFIK